MQGWFSVCAQPMRDVVTKYHRLSLAGRKPRISHIGWPVDAMTNDIRSESLFCPTLNALKILPGHNLTHVTRAQQLCCRGIHAKIRSRFQFHARETQGFQQLPPRQFREMVENKNAFSCLEISTSMNTFLSNSSAVNFTEHHWWWVNINQRLCYPSLMQISVARRLQQVKLC